MADERSEEERSGAKRRGRGLGRRNTGFEKKLQYKHQKIKKIAGLYAKAPSHEKHFASLDVRGLWHARPLPTASALDKSRPAAAQK
ncbi:MAG: hypothetical protein IJ590_02055 [Rickettsiales bacterium]|nr:hypothetical protein [Rickettsiales bacterium]